MPKSRSDLRILLMQIREHPEVRQEELESFARYSGLKLDQFTILDVFSRSTFDSGILEGFDALYVGGASEASVLDPELYPFVYPACDLLLACIELDIPVFASCFGFQLCVIALDGQVIHSSNQFEMGTIPINVSQSGRQDLLYHDMPKSFLAVSVHKEKSLSPPSGCIELAYTDQCCHAFRVEGKPFWACQFHPEVDRDCLVKRLTIYKNNYLENDEHLEEVLKNSQETPEANALMGKFVDRVLLSEAQASLSL